MSTRTIAPDRAEPPAPVTLFLAGDVMLGRGVDQIFPVSCPPGLHQPFRATARTYVDLAEKAHGPIPRPADPAYVWGDALAEIDRTAPAARIVNLETSVTTHGRHDPTKWIHYRMHPGNLACLAAAGIDGVALANNHVLDWSLEGLRETLDTLERAGIAATGAGRDERSAWVPVALHVGEGARILLVSFGFPDSGIPLHWAAGPDAPGVALLPDFSDASVSTVAAAVESRRRPGDLVVASIHWGGNWGYAVPDEHRSFARRLVERAGVDLVHGHSSHHTRPIEIHAGRLILYGCGDCVNDYEGVGLQRKYRGDLVLLYFPRIDRDGTLVDLRMAALRTRRFRLERPPAADVDWLAATLDRECQPFGTRIRRDGGELVLA